MNVLRALNILVLGGAGLLAMAQTDVAALVQAADAAPKNVAANLAAGKALMAAGNMTKAADYLRKGGNEAQPWLAKIEFEQYKFTDAAARAEKYLASKHNADSEAHRVAEDILSRGELASTMLDRVEKVIVIDSIVVDKDKFFKAYCIAPTTGSIASPSVLPQDFKAASPGTVYVNESGERMIWGQPDKDGKIHLVESNHLADGSWEKPHDLGDDLRLGADANYPFLLPDGQTLYYASNGEGSLGGYDIYITRRDDDGSYLMPTNLGMPYNSPADDYLLAIDEATGAGWWATDRNLIPGKVTIYVFVPQELRDNYPVGDTPDLVDRARITSIAATQRPGEDYSKYLEAIANTAPTGRNQGGGESFMLSLPDGRVVTSMSGFSSPEAADLMADYLAAAADYNGRVARLAEMRRSYAQGHKELAGDILGEETEVAQQRNLLQRMRNKVVEAEMQ